jgi:NAD kinase
MDRLTENKIVLVKRKTRLDELIHRFNTISQAKFYIEHLGADFSDYQKEHENYQNAVIKAEKALGELGRVQVIDRQFLPNFVFGPQDIVIALGQDGMVANTLKYLNEQPLIGVNPDPKRWDGVLLPFTVKDLKLVIPEVFKKIRPIKEITMAKAVLNDGQTLYAVNDLFIGQKTHVSARYRLQLGDVKEQQSSSGIIVSTGLGSTGWLKSVLAGASGVAKNFLNEPTNGFWWESDLSGATGVANNFKPPKQLQWGSNYLCFSVREPFPSKTTGVSLVFGTISNSKPLQVLSQMPENGVIFSDGIEADFLSFNSGVMARIEVAEKKGRLVV